VLVTNKRESAKRVVLFHHGRGAQEAIFGMRKMTLLWMPFPPND